MKTQKTGKTPLALIVIVFLTMASASFAPQTMAQEKTAKDVKQKVTEDLQAIEKYSVKQRNEAVKKAKIALDDLDARIDSLESRLDKRWEQMDQSARRKSQSALRALRKERNEVAEWYGGLKHASGKEWEEVKKGFLKSYQKLQGSLEKAHGES